jgi:Tfp pilus assembly pilus retraction ATPase PilT
MTFSRFDQLIAAAVEPVASDLHLIVGVPPAFRIAGEIMLRTRMHSRPKPSPEWPSAS